MTEEVRVQVIATENGFYGNVWRAVGDAFFIADEAEMSQKWMKLHPEEEAKREAASGDEAKAKAKADKEALALAAKAEAEARAKAAQAK